MHIRPDLVIALSQALWSSLWQGAALSLLAALVLGALGPRRAALKHALGMGFLLAMLLVPLATFLALLGGPTVTDAVIPTSSHPGLRDLLPPGAALTRPPLWLPLLWLSGVALMTLRLLGGWWMVHRLDQRAFEMLPPAWRTAVETLRQTMRIRRPVEVRLLRHVGLPCSARAWRPVIWLPLSMLTRLTPDQIEALIAHELAHIRRLDWVWNGLQCVIEAVLFYHPGVWWLSRRVRQERENACDDMAVAACGDPIVLAEALAGLERLRAHTHVFTAPTLVLSAHGGALMQRVTRLLSPDTTRLRWSMPAGLLALFCSTALLATTQTLPPAPATLPAAATAASAATPATPVTDATRGNRQIEIDDMSLRGRRVYRQWLKPGGHTVESYTVNGKPAPIDAEARRWIEHKLAAITPPPPPPAAPAPPVPPAPPAHARGPWRISQDAVEIAAPSPQGLRVYKKTANHKGVVKETYTVNGHAAPIDPAVRQWLKTRRADVTPLPPPPPPPPAPPLPPPPPMPPAPDAG